MRLPTVTIVLGIILPLSHNSQPDSTGTDWKTADGQCRSQNDSLPNIQDVQNKLSDLRGLTPIWSSVRGHFTPWIAYRGCFYENPHSTHFTKTIFNLERGTVGNCYFQCKLMNNTNGGCANNNKFFFRLQMTLCLCLCGKIIIGHISESAGCHSCGKSFDDGECGGYNHYSLYEIMDIKLPDPNFGGFCLTRGLQGGSNVSVLYSINCNDNASGYCVSKYGEDSSLSPIVSTFASYWMYCKRYSIYIIGTTDPTFFQRNRTRIWTGLQKYKIGMSNVNDESCYTIEIHQNTINYKKRNCTEKTLFLCKNEVGYNYKLPYISTNNASLAPTRVTSKTTKTSPSIDPVHFSVTFWKTSISNDTTPLIVTSISPLTSSTSESNTVALVGSIVAGVVAVISFVFIFIFMFKRRRIQRMQSKQGNFQCMESKQQQQQPKSVKVFTNTIYDDLVITNQRPDVIYANTTLENDNQDSICNKDDVYVEKEEEYDHLHTSRQKHVTMQADDDRYGGASFLDKVSYSTLGQNKNVEPDIDDGYCVTILPSSKEQLSAMNTPEYDYCYQSNQRKDW